MSQNFNPANCLQVYELTREERLGLIQAKHWFSEDAQKLPITPEDYLVVRWFDFYDGRSSHIEGLTTISMSREYDDAEIVYQKYINGKKTVSALKSKSKPHVNNIWDDIHDEVWRRTGRALVVLVILFFVAMYFMMRK